jgi:hypothetical protein
LDVRTNILQWGFHCAGCRKHYKARPLHWKKFSGRDGGKAYVQYIRKCVGRHPNDIDMCMLLAIRVSGVMAEESDKNEIPFGYQL